MPKAPHYIHINIGEANLMQTLSSTRICYASLVGGFIFTLGTAVTRYLWPLAASRVPLALWKGAGKSIDVPVWFGTYEVLLAGVLGIVLAVFSLMSCKITHGSNKGFAIGYVIGLVGALAAVVLVHTSGLLFTLFGGFLGGIASAIFLGAMVWAAFPSLFENDSAWWLVAGTKSVWFASLGGVVTGVGTGVSIGAFLTFGAGVGLTFAVIYIIASWAVYGLFLFVRRIGLLGPQDLWHSA
jgi:hypothetical protein